jgi:hypothetical protein
MVGAYFKHAPTIGFIVIKDLIGFMCLITAGLS